MARFICLSCFRSKFNVPSSHKKPFNRSEICKGKFMRIFETFDVDKWLMERDLRRIES